MKNITITFYQTLAAVALISASFAAVAATEVSSAPAGQVSMGVINVSGGDHLSALKHRMSNEADAQGATSYRVIFATGENHFYGRAELYR
ncbi:DUF1471 domain-containing protein [Rouxiella badensis]|uniref:Multiple stress resistance protein BhsA n=1 Tax=Rouxiella badensis TaxID=1646377 RepID=A0A1X0WKV3_9GAMM|nr:YdgH/BhsA/McbA-like domain containing protein [Rouxiella badensis]MCC3701009.1 DUF1471 domain-containing protein [Rouxiella badensis]MCC3717436.1 DUF1471 domain-containing protein [Rouxiella badensis]MCC3727620.1 DUF1471 domain-containing protein [Rouxiella badensis]MCC3732436.1 DUF1471 domain-containing protein [Rouxiella badensis]MCC3740452.1 DUF1471 domain-containing protein [Rouxiella badensis]